MEELKASSSGRKRPIEQDFQNSPYYKIRAVVKDLRPHFIEVLKTPDFQNCKAAADIREGMKVMMDLYKEIVAESVKLERCNSGPGYVSSNNIQNGPKPTENQQDVKPAENSHQNEASSKPTNQHVQGTYIVGGSALGWNFITFQSSKAVYYGRSKESFRATNPKSSIEES